MNSTDIFHLEYLVHKRTKTYWVPPPRQKIAYPALGVIFVCALAIVGFWNYVDSIWFIIAGLAAMVVFLTQVRQTALIMDGGAHSPLYPQEIAWLKKKLTAEGLAALIAVSEEDAGNPEGVLYLGHVWILAERGRDRGDATVSRASLQALRARQQAALVGGNHE